MGIRIILSSASMGDVTPRDFDAWASYVGEHIQGALGIEIEHVECLAFGDAGDDMVYNATSGERQAIMEWLRCAGFESFCADPGAWPQDDKK